MSGVAGPDAPVERATPRRGLRERPARYTTGSPSRRSGLWLLYLVGCPACPGLGGLLRRLEREGDRLAGRIGEQVADRPLLAIPGLGPLTAAKLIGEVGDVSRFRSHEAFAALAGVASIPASSGQVRRMRLNRGGNRQLNRALFTVALVQCRMPATRPSSLVTEDAQPPLVLLGVDLAGREAAPEDLFGRIASRPSRGASIDHPDDDADDERQDEQPDQHVRAHRPPFGSFAPMPSHHPLLRPPVTRR
jgi:hypothetical protein